jgi:hypothetical protein
MDFSIRIMAWAVLALPALTASLLLPAPRGQNLGLLSRMVLYAFLLIFSVQIPGFLEIAGLTEDWSIGKCLVVQVVFLLLAILKTRGAKRPQAERADFALRPWSNSRLPPYLIVAGLILALTYSVFLVNLVTSHPISFDALAYHLPLAVRWLQDNTMQISASADWRVSLPGNAEICMALLLATGHEFLAPLGNLLALCILLLASYEMAQACSRDREASFVSVLLLASLPILQNQAFSAYVDLFGSAFVLASVAFLWQAHVLSTQAEIRSEFYRLLMLAGLSAGIAVGTKPTFSVFVGLLALAFGWLTIKSRKLPYVGVVKVVALFVGCMALPVAFWVFRAIANTGNPVYPFAVHLGGFVNWPGVRPEYITPVDYDLTIVRSRAEWLMYPWIEWKSAPGELLIGYGMGSGLGAAFATFIPVGMLWWTWRLLRRGGKLLAQGEQVGAAQLSCLLMGWLALSAVAWWFLLHRMLRFGIPMLSVSCVLMAPFLVALNLAGTRVFRLLLLLSVASTCLLSLATPGFSLAKRLYTGDWTRSTFYALPNCHKDIPAGSTVLNLADSTKNFSLAGEDLDIRVIWSYDLPDVLTREFLREKSVDYVYEEDERVASMGAENLGVQLVCNESKTLRDGSTKSWRIWVVSE